LNIEAGDWTMTENKEKYVEIEIYRKTQVLKEIASQMYQGK
jgi:hypothetical protein